MREESFRLMPMLTKNTKDSRVLCELGAGIFRLFRHYDKDIEIAIGIEMCQTYIDERLDKNAIALQGNVYFFKEILEEAGYNNIDVITIIDVLEHLDKDEAKDLLKRAKKCSKRILAFTPLGFDEQTGHDEYDFARPGLKNRFTEEQRDLAIELQRHKSGWEASDFEELGFQDIVVDRNYHRKGEGAIWARWDK